MAAITRARGSSSTYGIFNCLASSSRSVAARHPARHYATESNEHEDDPEVEGFGTMAAAQRSEAIIKKWTGKGVPHLNSLRNRVSVYHPHLWKGRALKELTVPKRKKGGRDESGRIVTRHIGGGAKQRIRSVDFYRFVPGVHDVIRIEYDPGRSAHIALLKWRNEGGPVTAGEVDEARKVAWQVGVASGPDRGRFPMEAKRSIMSGWSYILAPEGLRAGDTVSSFRMGIPDDFVEGWFDVRNRVAPQSELREEAVAEAADELAELDLDGEGASAEVEAEAEAAAMDAEPLVIDDDPASPQTVNSPVVMSETEAANKISPRALSLFRTESLKVGNVLPLYLIPPGTQIHNLTLNPMAKMRLVRSAGATAQVVGHQDLKGNSLGGLDVLHMGGHMRHDGSTTRPKGWVLIKMSSGEVRKVVPGAVATIGRVSNKEHHHVKLGKAGRARWLGRRPRVRGVAMNAVDHPMGGGKGKGKGGKESTSIYGWTSKGRRTRRSSDKDGNKLVVKERPRATGMRKRK